jgi:hypothetical protein
MRLGRVDRDAAIALASIYQHAWRVDAPRLSIRPQLLAVIVPVLLGAGGGPIAWTRLGEAADEPSLRAVHRLQSAAGVAWQQITEQVMNCLRTAKVDAIVAKGWTVARRYPHLALRPYGDVDVLVRHCDLQRAETALTRDEVLLHVDLHWRWEGLTDTTFDRLLERSGEVCAATSIIRVLAPEDELRYLCLHYAKHGGARPLWLCDVGLLIERAPPDFDWFQVLGVPSSNRRAVEAVLNLAVSLLGAAPTGSSWRAQTPEWLLHDTYATWLRGVLHPSRTLRFRDISHLPNNLRERFPSALRATYLMGAHYGNRPRLPLRFAAMALRGAAFVVGRAPEVE